MWSAVSNGFSCWQGCTLRLFARAVSPVRALSKCPSTECACEPEAEETRQSGLSRLLLCALVWKAFVFASCVACGACLAADGSIRASSLGLKVATALRRIGWPDEAVVFAVATLPVLELRGAIPVGYWMQLDPLKLTVLSILGFVGSLWPNYSFCANWWKFWSWWICSSSETWLRCRSSSSTWKGLRLSSHKGVRWQPGLWTFCLRGPERRQGPWRSSNGWVWCCLWRCLFLVQVLGLEPSSRPSLTCLSGQLSQLILSVLFWLGCWFICSWILAWNMQSSLVCLCSLHQLSYGVSCGHLRDQSIQTDEETNSASLF